MIFARSRSRFVGLHQYLPVLLTAIGCVSCLLSVSFAQDVPVDQEPDKTTATKFTDGDPPPITRIVLYSSGLSQIVHEGQVNGNERVAMKFSRHDVDDVLKSLVFEDKNGGIVRSVEYKPAPDSQDVAAQELGPALTLAQTLTKYRGESVSIELEGGVKTSGNILSVENRQSGKEFVETITIANKNGFESFPINEFKQIQFDDEKLREEFKLAMAGLTKGRQAELKQLDLLFEGAGQRDVRYSYNVDAPIWRMTYRLDLSPGKSTLQGWAHIDNVTGVDWKAVQLDLRSGRPQSFHVELFAPVLAERTSFGLDIFDIPSDKTLSAQWFGAGAPDQLSGSLGFGGGGGGGGGGGFGGGAFGGGGAMGKGKGLGSGGPLSGGGGAAPKKSMDINSAFRQSASTSRSNKMVRFLIKDPVSLAAGRSAMVPVISEKLPVELYSMFMGGTADRANLIAQVENTAETPLVPGPVTVYMDGDFVGDGALDRIEMRQFSELVYGTDLAVSLAREELPEKEVVKSVRLHMEGFAKIEIAQTVKTKYGLRNDDSIKREFLLQVPLVSKQFSPAPTRQEGKIAFYELECEAKTTVELTVSQENQLSNTVSLTSLTAKNIAEWQNDLAEIDASLIAKLEKIFAQKESVAKAQADYQRAQAKRADIEQEQKRLTDIIRVLKPESNSAVSYLEKLSNSESDLETAQEQESQFAQVLLDAERQLKDLSSPTR